MFIEDEWVYKSNQVPLSFRITLPIKLVKNRQEGHFFLSGQLEQKCARNHGIVLYTQQYHVRIIVRYIQFKSIQISPKNKTFLDYKRYLTLHHLHQKSTSVLPFFLRFWKGFANLFWVLWA